MAVADGVAPGVGAFAAALMSPERSPSHNASGG
ncbi:MAG: hypothetical protein QOE76_3343 [Frankiales bacterium]|jgi:hypothetical protein|nr:hypothetical protein [Frankiales bacterium]